MPVFPLYDPKYAGEYGKSPDGTFYAVWKGFDGVHWPGKERRVFSYKGFEVKGSIIVGNLIKKGLGEVKKDLTAKQVMVRINNSVRAMQTRRGLSMKKSEDLCGAPLIIAKDCGDHYEVAYVGDTFALAVYRDGRIQMTKNQTLKYNIERYDEIDVCYSVALQEAKQRGFDPKAATSEQFRAIEQEMWRQFGPILAGARMAYINNSNSELGYGVLNGQRQLEDMIITLKISKQGLQYLMLGNSGMASLELQRNSTPESVGRFLHDWYSRGGPSTLVKAIRAQEAQVYTPHRKGKKSDLAGLVIEMG